MKTWLILDCNFLCWRAFHSMGGLKHGGVSTGVVFGFMKEVQLLQEAFRSTNVVFCFDYGDGKRKKILPSYKEKRHSKELTEEELQEVIAFRMQVKKLRTSYLSLMGFKNVFFQKGFESDDIIASIVKHLPKTEEGVIVTSDGDLLQLIRPHVIFHNPGKKETVTYQSFFKQWGFKPRLWWKVKALGGCSTDEVPGIPKIGEKTAAKYLRGELKEDSVAFNNIESDAGRATYKLNTKLVKLPMAGTNKFTLVDDEFDVEGWNEVCTRLGFKSLIKKKKRKGLLYG